MNRPGLPDDGYFHLTWIGHVRLDLLLDFEGQLGGLFIADFLALHDYA